MELGSDEGMVLGITDGMELGSDEGMALGMADSMELGFDVGMALGMADGMKLGFDADMVFMADGMELGFHKTMTCIRVYGVLRSQFLKMALFRTGYQPVMFLQCAIIQDLNDDGTT
eukprot:3999955-Ditylum_brightwellii.AAC.1